MPKIRSDKEFRLVQDGHEPIFEAPHVPAVYAYRYGRLTLLQVMEINTIYALQVMDRTCRAGETLATTVLRQLGTIIHG